MWWGGRRGGGGSHQRLYDLTRLSNIVNILWYIETPRTQKKRKNADKPPFQRNPKSFFALVQRRWWQDLYKLGCVNSHRGFQHSPAIVSVSPERTDPAGCIHAGGVSTGSARQPRQSSMAHSLGAACPQMHRTIRVTWKFHHRLPLCIQMMYLTEATHSYMHCRDLYYRKHICNFLLWWGGSFCSIQSLHACELRSFIGFVRNVCNWWSVSYIITLEKMKPENI